MVHYDVRCTTGGCDGQVVTRTTVTVGEHRVGVYACWTCLTRHQQAKEAN